MGKLIVIEGIDGSGKSTQFKLLCDRLSAQGHQFKRLVFPRYDEPSSALIKMYLGGDFGNDPDSVNAYAASSFFAVDRYASYIQDWRDYYETGGIILTDRYTTSNALHQGVKISSEQREHFFMWLYDYEFNLLGMPAPDMVVYMDVAAEISTKRLRQRQAQTDIGADIHENDVAYLKDCAKIGKQAAALHGWLLINCVSNGKERSIDDIHIEIYNRVIGLL